MTEEKLRTVISKCYHSMIDWEATMFCGFHDTIVLMDRGQATKILPRSVYGGMREINWYLRQIKADPNIEW